MAMPAPHPAPPRAAIARATLVGSGAILLWSTLALLATWAAAVPPLLLTGLAFTIAGVLSVAGTLLRDGRAGLRSLRQPWPVWAIGVGGLFGYHLCYFLALRRAPAVEANLINYFWPLFIVVLSGLLPGERLRWFHLAGCLFALAGCALLVTRGGTVAVEARYWPGYLLALGAAIVWAIYSVASRRFGGVPSEIVGFFCLITGALALVAHALLEPPRWPVGREWALVLALGLGPLGLAFFLWDHGCKRGDIRALGALAYLAPLLSTALLVAAGAVAGSSLLWLAAGAIVVGALLASGDALPRRRPPSDVASPPARLH